MKCTYLFVFSLIMFSPVAIKAAEISWSPAFEIETDADIDVSKPIVRAVNVVSPGDVDEIEVEFPGDITVEFEPEHTFEFNLEFDEGIGSGSVTGTGNYYTVDGLTTENDELDAIFDNHGWVGGGPEGGAIAVLELLDLEIGESYQIQLIGAADDRGCCEYRQMEIWNDDLETVDDDLWFGRSNDFDEDDERGPGSTIGTFVADADNQLIYLVGTSELDDGAGNLGNGADPGLSAYVLSLAGPTGPRGDYNGNGELDTADLDLQSQAIKDGDLAFDENADGVVNIADRILWVNELKNTWMGDADLNGVFNSSDFVVVFSSAKYETGQPAVWTQGDWDGDGVFNSSDFVAAFSNAGYETGPRPGGPNPGALAVPEPSSVVMVLISLVGLMGSIRRRQSSE